MPKRAPLLCSLGLGFLVLLPLLPLPSSAQTCPAPTADELQVLDRINAERVSAGVAPVAMDGRLVAAAVRHSEDMRDGCFLSHTGSDGSSFSSRMLDAGYPDPGREAAGAGQTSPAQIVSGWMNSSAHRAILLDARHTHVGIGYAMAPGTCFLTPFNATIAAHFWTADFGEDTGEPVPPGSCESPPVPECADGLDNDGNGLTDFADDLAGCDAVDDPVEAPGCRDGMDNDGDGLVDHPDDPGCLSPDQLWEHDPHCGLGFELALGLPLLLALRRRVTGPLARV